MDLFDIAVASKLAGGGGGGGGGSNVVFGNFTTNETSGVQEVTIPYTGEGYPINVYIMSTDLAIGSTTESKPTGSVCVQKKNTAVAPTYSGGEDDKVDIYELCRYNTTTTARFSFAKLPNNMTFFSQNAPTSADCQRIKMSAKNKLKVHVAESAGAGLLPNATYVYTIEYSE